MSDNKSSFQKQNTDSDLNSCEYLENLEDLNYQKLKLLLSEDDKDKLNNYIKKIYGKEIFEKEIIKILNIILQTEDAKGIVIKKSDLKIKHPFNIEYYEDDFTDAFKKYYNSNNIYKLKTNNKKISFDSR